MRKEPNAARAFFAIKDIGQVGIDWHIEFGVALVKRQASAPHGIGEFGSLQPLAFLGAPIANRRGKGDHAQVGHGADVLVVAANVRNVGTQDGVVIFGAMKHVLQTRVPVVGKVHVRVRLHAKVLHFDWIE